LDLDSWGREGDFDDSAWSMALSVFEVAFENTAIFCRNEHAKPIWYSHKVCIANILAMISS